MIFSNLVAPGSALLSLLLRASLVSANINVYNWCSFDVYAYQVVSGDCPRGQDFQCYAYDTHLNPYVIRSGSETIFSILEQPGAKIYLAKVNNIQFGTLQFEYTLNKAQSILFWDLSLMDGTAPGVPGNVFVEENVTATPTGDIADATCIQATCPPAGATTECMQAYWVYNDDAQAMRACPMDTGDILLDLCGFVRSFTPWTKPAGTKKLRNRFNRSE